MDWTLQLIVMPVTDIDRARFFYEGLGFHADHDHTVSDELRFVQMTPPGSSCSIAFGRGLTPAEPGSVKGMQMCVEDIDAAYAELRAVSLEVDEPVRLPWGDFLYFDDPDGNGWSVQSVKPGAAAKSV